LHSSSNTVIPRAPKDLNGNVLAVAKEIKAVFPTAGTVESEWFLERTVARRVAKNYATVVPGGYEMGSLFVAISATYHV